MNIYKEIYEYIERTPIFDDSVYNKLTEIYGQQEVNGFIENKLRERDEEPLMYMKIIGLGNDNCDFIVNKILLVRLKEITDGIFLLVKHCGFPTKNNDVIGTVEAIDRDTCDKRKLEYILELYQEYIIVRNRVCEYNLKLVDKAMEKYPNTTNYDELYQEGVIALIRAINTYDYSRDEFIPYALFIIHHEIWKHFHDFDFSTSVTSEAKTKFYKLVEAIRLYESRFHKPPAYKVMASMTGLSINIIPFYISLYSDIGESLSSFVPTDCGYVKLGDTISLPSNTVSVEDEAIYGSLKQTLQMLMDELTECQREVIVYRYFSDRKYTFSEIAQIRGTTYQNIQELHSNAIKKLKKHKDDLVKYL